MSNNRIKSYAALPMTADNYCHCGHVLSGYWTREYCSKCKSVYIRGERQTAIRRFIRWVKGQVNP